MPSEDRVLKGLKDKLTRLKDRKAVEEEHDGEAGESRKGAIKFIQNNITIIDRLIKAHKRS